MTSPDQDVSDPDDGDGDDEEGLGVEAADDLPQPGTHESVEEALADAQEILAEIDPDNVAIAGICVVAKDGPLVQNVGGDTWQFRVTSPNTEGLDGMTDVFSCAHAFNRSLDEMEIDVSADATPEGGPEVVHADVDLGSLLGL